MYISPFIYPTNKYLSSGNNFISVSSCLAGIFLMHSAVKELSSNFHIIINLSNPELNKKCESLCKNLKAEIQKQNEPEQQIPPVETDNEQHIL